MALSTDVGVSVPVCVCVFILQKIEARVAADEDLKLADLLKYYLRESQAAKVSAAPSPAVIDVLGIFPPMFPGHVTAAGPPVPPGPGSGGL